jgi:lysophospholipase L1-like esterase
MAKLLPEDDRTLRVPVIVFSVVAVFVAMIWIFLQYGIAPVPEPRATTLTGSLVFIGSSTIHRFPLEASFPNARRRCVNLGVPDQNALALRERLPTEIPAEAVPAGLVLYAGSYDLRAESGLSPVQIRDRVAGVVNDLRSRFPTTPLVLIEILSARAQTDAERSALAELNGALGAFALENGAVFVKTNRPPLADEKGDLPESLSVDRFHLNPEGYRVLAKWLKEDGGAVGEMLR